MLPVGLLLNLSWAVLICVAVVVLLAMAAVLVFGVLKARKDKH